jgi:xanthine dehydrogenase accessory factor
MTRSDTGVVVRPNQRPGASGDVLDAMIALRADKLPFALATVVETVGSVSAKTGAKAVIDQSGRVVAGWVGGGCAESTVCHTAVECLQTHETRVVELDMNDEVLGTGMPCGGSARVFVEPVLPKPMLWILGHGRVAETVCSIGALMGFDVVVDDPMADAMRYPDAVRLLTDDLDYSQLTVHPDDYVVVATQHRGDHESIPRLLHAGVCHVALIASSKRSRLVLDFLREEGFGEGYLARVRAPAGLDLGARTPEEIALSVVSEIVMLRRRGSGAHKDERLRRPSAASEPEEGRSLAQVPPLPRADVRPRARSLERTAEHRVEQAEQIAERAEQRTEHAEQGADAERARVLAGH